jgi:hypothetical protein
MATGLAFLSDSGSPSQSQVYVIDVDGNAPAQRVTSVKGQLANRAGRPTARSSPSSSSRIGPGHGRSRRLQADAGVVGDVVEEQRIRDRRSDVEGACAR